MSYRSYALATGVIFLVIAVLHMLRVSFGWDATIAQAAVPKWVSWIALLIAGYLAYEGFRVSFSRSIRKETKPALHSGAFGFRFLPLVGLAAHVHCRCNLFFLLRDPFLAAPD